TLINIACGLLKKQINSLAEAFESEGGFTEKLYATRKKKRETHKARRPSLKFRRKKPAAMLPASRHENL
ncbi:four helix bundle suffix domain-containing protein, partial [Sedimentisphaera salicampi]